jgi:phage FluMu protein Com
MNAISSKKEILFNLLNEKLRMLDASTGGNIRCPLCWKLFASSASQAELSVEHIPPTAAARLIKELPLTTLTCKQCNHTYGSKYHSQLKKYLEF